MIGLLVESIRFAISGIGPIEKKNIKTAISWLKELESSRNVTQQSKLAKHMPPTTL